VRLQNPAVALVGDRGVLQFERVTPGYRMATTAAGTRPSPHVLARGGCAIDRYQYLLLMAACLVVTLPLEFVLGAVVYRRFRAVLWALVPVALVFSIWDVAGIARHHWSYNPRFVTGITLGFGMPLEELVFFLVIPICGLLTYEAVGCTLVRVGRLRRLRAR